MVERKSSATNADVPNGCRRGDWTGSIDVFSFATIGIPSRWLV
jgi:hypothetical protein